MQGVLNGSNFQSLVIHWNRTQATAHDTWWLSCNLWVEIWVTCKQMVPISVGQSTTISMIQQMITELHPSICWRYHYPRPPHPPCCNPWSRYHLTVRKDLPPTPQRQQQVTQQAVEGSKKYPKKKPVDRLVVYWKYPIFQVIVLINTSQVVEFSGCLHHPATWDSEFYWLVSGRFFWILNQCFLFQIPG